MKQIVSVSACLLLLTTFALLSYASVRTKSPVFDEPLHAVSGWTQLRTGDFRMSFEDRGVAHLDIGIRHVLPALPFLFIGIGWVGSVAMQRRRTPVLALAAAILIGLSAETLHAFPDYVAFFNGFVGGPRAGLALLGDSNLDRGQDLPLLAEWQRHHPDQRLYLSYFGVVEPLLMASRTG
jgi:hypothetical protein